MNLGTIVGLLLGLALMGLMDLKQGSGGSPEKIRIKVVCSESCVLILGSSKNE